MLSQGYTVLSSVLPPLYHGFMISQGLQQERGRSRGRRYSPRVRRDRIHNNSSDPLVYISPSWPCVAAVRWNSRLVVFIQHCLCLLHDGLVRAGHLNRDDLKVDVVAVADELHHLCHCAVCRGVWCQRRSVSMATSCIPRRSL